MNWMWNGSHTKSLDELNKLVHDVLLAPDFRQEHLASFDAKRETSRLDLSLMQQSDGSSNAIDAWREVDVLIDVPDGKPHRTAAEGGIPTFAVPGLHHRSITQVIKAAWTDLGGLRFHYTPFKEFWQQPEQELPQRIYGELYLSDAFIKAHKELLELPTEPGCTLERVVCGLMFWSDSTHLASFGNASLWPIYMFFGNQSKYDHVKPKSGACHHIAYIPKLPDTFHDWFFDLTGTGPTADVLTHCRHEVMHAVWSLLLDNEFLQAYEHGIVLQCGDGIMRRVYPCIFTYSADYPEKILLATIRNLGSCPCPRCKTPKAKISEIRMKRDEARQLKDARVDDSYFRRLVEKARNFIYRDVKGVKSSWVESLLGKESLVPTKNAFSDKLSRFGFNVFSVLVIDLLHEFELGVWKATFTHLLQILYAQGDDAIQRLNQQ
ncbi:hypothetical protein OE88DRAFT_1714347 [Heliocybe sulcata]|uniref:Uncharacterized protein n=1 Tax=Heliocybe sulcata TaxID=5364 RepID=A0A5C3MRV6_9AGAM|nr:hypothetical protein OE88DRAFT_1714347 [Heliocybe sulcata]